MATVNSFLPVFGHFLTKNDQIRLGGWLPYGSHFLKGKIVKKGEFWVVLEGVFWLKNDQNLVKFHRIFDEISFRKFLKGNFLKKISSKIAAKL